MDIYEKLNKACLDIENNLFLLYDLDIQGNKSLKVKYAEDKTKIIELDDKIKDLKDSINKHNKLYRIYMKTLKSIYIVNSLKVIPQTGKEYFKTALKYILMLIEDYIYEIKSKEYMTQ